MGLSDEEEVDILERPVPEGDTNQIVIEADRSLVRTGTELTMLSGEFPDGSVWEEITD